jgi:hypothetical protein
VIDLDPLEILRGLLAPAASFLFPLEKSHGEYICLMPAVLHS